MFKFLNNGTSIVEVPERDLAVEEFNGFPEWLKVIIKNSGAYKFVEIVEAQESTKPDKPKR